MRRLVVSWTILAVLMVTALLTVPAAAQKYQGETMHVYAGITPQVREDIMAYIAPRLKEKYGLNLAVEPIGSAPMLERILIQRDNPRVTIAGWDEPIGIQACEMGLCAPIDLELTPNVKDLYDFARNEINGQVQVVTSGITAIGLIYNSQEFERRKLSPPTSWADLWRSDLADRVSITALESTWGTAAFAHLNHLAGGTEDDPDSGFEMVQSLLPNIHTIYTWSSELSQLMQLGEVWLATSGSNMAPAMQAQGFPALWVAPVEGAPLAGGAMSIIANAPYQDAAHDFVNLFFSPEFQALRARNGGVVPTNPNTWDLLTADEIGRLPLLPSDVPNLVTLNWGRINEVRGDWLERWHREIGN